MKIHEFLDSPDKWTQGETARDADGRFCMSSSSKAVSWCILGAYNRLHPNGTSQSDWEYTKRWMDFRESLGCSVPNWNDMPGRTWEEVHAKLKEFDL